MKLRDTLRLSFKEAGIDKKGSVRFVLLEILLTGMTFFLLTVGLRVHGVVENVLAPAYPDGYVFYFNNTSKDDSNWLGDMGFYDVEVIGEKAVSGRIEHIGMIWLNKIRAVLRHKDIYGGELEDVCAVMLFLQVIFISLAVIFFMCAVGISGNLCAMTLGSRKKYIMMLKHLGLDSAGAGSIFAAYFLSIWGIAAIGGVIAAQLFLCFTDRFLSSLLLGPLGTGLFDYPVFAVLLLLPAMMLVFGKEWRKHAK